MTPKSSMVYRSLKECAQKMPPGSRFPSVRDLMRRHRVSQVVLDKAIKSLKDEGLLEAHVGDGTYVAGLEKASKLRPPALSIGFVMPDYPSEYYLLVAKSMIEACERAKLECKATYVHCNDTIESQLEGRDFDGLIVYPPKMPFNPAEISFLKSTGIPFVVLELNMQFMGIDSVGADEELSGALAAKHLIDLGHRRLAVLSSEPAVSVIQARISGFMKQAEISGLPRPRLISADIPVGANSIDNAMSLASGLLKETPLPFTGLFVTSDAPAQGVMKSFIEAGLKIPADVSVVGARDIESSKYYHPSLSSVFVDYGLWGSTAVELLKGRIAGDRSPAQWLCVGQRLIQRQSSSSPRIS